MGAGASTSASGEVRQPTQYSYATPVWMRRSHGVADVGGWGACRMQIVIGDVVTIQIVDYPKRVIGLVADVHDDLCSVQVSNTEIIREIPRVEVQRIACWSEIEDGDIVKVREKCSRLYHEATVVLKNEDDGTFRVRFKEDEEDEIEDRVEPERILKLMSGRLEQKEWMMYKETPDEAQ